MKFALTFFMISLLFVMVIFTVIAIAFEVLEAFQGERFEGVNVLISNAWDRMTSNSAFGLAITIAGLVTVVRSIAEYLVNKFRQYKN